MTVSSQTPINTYTYVSGSVFAYTFRILASTDLVVTDAGVPKILGLDYTVSGVGNNAGGNVTLLYTPTAGNELALLRATTLTRATDYQAAGEFLSSQVNADFDRIWLAIQELSTTGGVGAGGGISITIPPTEYGNFGLELPDAATRALTTLCFDAVGQILLIPTADLTIQLSALPIITSTSDASDRVILYSPGAGAGRSITVESILGGKLGDGLWRLAAGQLLSAGVAEDLEFVTAVSSLLQRGTYNTGTYTFTATSATRLLVIASVGATIANGVRLTVEIWKNGVSFARATVLNEVTSGSESYIVTAAGYAALAPGDTVKARVTCSAGITTDSTADASYLAIIELG